MEEKKDRNKLYIEIFFWFIMLVAIVMMIYAGVGAYKYLKVNTKEYELTMLNSKYYGIYTDVHCDHPGYDYESIILRADGEVITFKGKINIHYVVEDFKVILEDARAHNKDVAHIYVPKDSIEFYYDVAGNN